MQHTKIIVPFHYNSNSKHPSHYLQLFSVTNNKYRAILCCQIKLRGAMTDNRNYN